MLQISSSYLISNSLTQLPIPVICKNYSAFIPLFLTTMQVVKRDDCELTVHPYQIKGGG